MLLVFDSRFVLLYFAAHKNFTALTELGICYRYGYGVGINKQEAVGLYRLAVDQRYSDAQFRLALCFMFGQGVEQGEREGARLFHAAALQSHSTAQHMMGDCYRNGRGVETNRMMAACFLHLAIELGEDSARKDFDWIGLSSVCML
jgi:TPR repeat protein